MAPQRSRNAPDDSRSDAPTTKEKQIAVLPTKARRGGHLAARSSLKDIAMPTTTTEVEQDVQDSSGGVRWYLIAFQTPHWLNFDLPYAD